MQRDTRILQYIRSNARMNLTTISRKTGIPVSTIFDRLKGRDGGVIKRFTALVDFAALGLPIRASVYLKVAPEDRASVKNALAVHDRVNNLYRVNNGFDFALECFFASIREIEEFLEQLELRHRILDKMVFHIIDDVATEKMLTIEE